MKVNDITYKIRGAIFKVYNTLGPGLLESVYEAALCYQLRQDGLAVATQVKIDVEYQGSILPIDYRIDLLVEDTVIIELKSVEELKPVHHKQLLTYLRLAHKPVGLLVNFNTADMEHSIHRKINGNI
ncbi:MAG: GxxExxY protein [Prevotella sp.]|nr:GxxExxY protein [Prevotella sp.]